MKELSIEEKAKHYMKRIQISSLMAYTNKIENARFFDRESSAKLSNGVLHGGEVKEVELRITLKD